MINVVSLDVYDCALAAIPAAKNTETKMCFIVKRIIFYSDLFSPTFDAANGNLTFA